MFNWITKESFDSQFIKTISKMNVGDLLEIPKIREILEKELHEEVVLELCVEADRCFTCGGRLSNDGYCPNKCEFVSSLGFTEEGE
jgi:hypothetical protein